ncbi:hypothetical protein D3C78_423720 [compost metagenome]
MLGGRIVGAHARSAGRLAGLGLFLAVDTLEQGVDFFLRKQVALGHGATAR